MKSSKWVLEPRCLLASQSGLTGMGSELSVQESSFAKFSRVMILAVVAALIAALPLLSKSQSTSSGRDPSPAMAIAAPAGPDLTYSRPSNKTRVTNYAFDAFGPYPIVGAGFAAGINQLGNAPPEWRQGAEGYGKRFGSDFAIAAIGTTTRYGLAEAFREDTLYYRCECRGPVPRLRHAVFSTLTGRRGEDGHRIFSISALVALYAGTMSAVYGWFPDRFGAKDAFRMGNYSLLGYMGSNIALEFVYGGPHGLLSKMHLNNKHGAPAPGPNH